MKTLKAVSMVFYITIALAMMSSAQTVKTDFDRTADFSHYKTYSWQKVDVKNSLWIDRIKSAVNGELIKKGWVQVTSGGDASIGAVGITSDHASLASYYNGMDGYRWDGFGNDDVIKEQREGTLVISIFDNGTKKLIWVGSSMNVVSDKSKKNIKNLDKGMQEMFEHFPPEPKS